MRAIEILKKIYCMEYTVREDNPYFGYFCTKPPDHLEPRHVAMNIETKEVLKVWR